MWTSRFGVHNAESTEKRSSDVTPSKSHLELEIKLNGKQDENEQDFHMQRKNYNHYVPETNYNRQPRKLSHRKVITVNGDVSLAQKKVFR